MLNGWDERQGGDGEKNAGLSCEEGCRTSLQIAQLERLSTPLFPPWLTLTDNSPPSDTPSMLPPGLSRSVFSVLNRK